MNLAIFSPSQNPYSETFIQTHKNKIKTDKTYYIYGSSLENMVIENKGLLINSKMRLLLKGTNKLLKRNKKPNFKNEAVKKLKSLQIDVALVEYGNHAMKLIEVFESARIPFIAHFHGYDISVKRIIEQNSNYKKLFERAAFIIGVSKLMCERLEDLGCPKIKIVHTACGAHSDFEKVQPLFRNKQILSIGRFVDKKAPYYTILAFGKVVKSFPDSKLIMVGDGMLFNTCKNLIKHYGLENNVELLGIQTPNKIKDIMHNSYCFVQHSITADNGNQEGTPVAIMEAALAGLPVISTNHAGIPDVIEHEKTGLLVDEHDVNGMAENIKRIFEDRELAVQLGNNAKRIHKSKYSLENHIKTIEDLLHKSIAQV